LTSTSLSLPSETGRMARGRGWTQREWVVVREKGRWKTPWPNPAGKLLAIGQSPAAGKFQAPNGLGGNVVRHVHHGQWHEYAVFISLTILMWLWLVARILSATLAETAITNSLRRACYHPNL
jgi:hypothetical protein